MNELDYTIGDKLNKGAGSQCYEVIGHPGIVLLTSFGVGNNEYFKKYFVFKQILQNLITFFTNLVMGSFILI